MKLKHITKNKPYWEYFEESPLDKTRGKSLSASWASLPAHSRVQPWAGDQEKVVLKAQGGKWHTRVESERLPPPKRLSSSTTHERSEEGPRVSER